MNSTVALIISVVIAFGITAALGFVIIPWLRKLKFGQTILDIGPKWHKKKQGTPNMGGIMFIIGIVVSFAVTTLIYHLSGGELESDYSQIMNGRELVLLFSGLLLALGCGIVGFIDDFTKIKLKRNEGLSPKQKTLGQLIVTLGYICTLWVSHNTSWYIPFVGTVNFEKNPANRYYLQLENVKDVGIASVCINGKDKGIVWTKPFRVDITDGLKKGENDVVVEVTNSWFNRVAGDEMAVSPTKYTQTNIVLGNDFRGNAVSEITLEPSGLLGPVTIQVAVEQK